MRTSVEEEYDNRSVIKQVSDIRKVAESTVSTAEDAKQQATQALASALNASRKADKALDVASGVNAKATQAIDTANTAITTAGNAQDVAEALSGTIDTANAKADEAIATATGAHTDAENALQKANSANQIANAVGAKADGAVIAADEAKVKAEDAVNRAKSAEKASGDAQATADAAEAKTIVNKNAIIASNTRIGLLETSQGQQDVRIDQTVKGVEIVTNATDGTVRSTKSNGSVSERAIPIASEVKAGLMNAQTMTNIRRMNERLRGLEDGYNVKYATFPSTSPSQEELTAAWKGAGGDTPTPIGAILRDIDKQLSYVWDGDMWKKPDVASIPLFGQGTSGLIKGGDPSKDGAIIAETDGTGSPQGWSVVKADIRNLQDDQITMDGQIAAIDADVMAMGKKVTKNTGDISALNTSVSENTSAIGTINTTLGDTSKGLVKKVNDTASAAESAQSAASSAGTKADNAKDAADKAVVNLTKSSTDRKIVLSATKGNAGTFDVNLDPVTSTKAGVMSADLFNHVVRDNQDATITHRYSFEVNPYVQEIKQGELESMRVAPVKQIHAAFVAADQKMNGIQTAVNGVNTKVDDIGVSLTTGGTPDAPTLTANVNGKESTVSLPGGGSKPKLIINDLLINSGSKRYDELKGYFSYDYATRTFKVKKDLFVVVANTKYSTIKAHSTMIMAGDYKEYDYNSDTCNVEFKTGLLDFEIWVDPITTGTISYVRIDGAGGTNYIVKIYEM